MLAVKTYAPDYIDACRARMDAQLTAYRALVAPKSRSATAPARSAVEAFEPLFLANLTLVLDSCFVHRTRAIEGKDGNPLNEVRMLCTSILINDGVLCADKTIKYDAGSSVLHLEIGDEIKLDEPAFRKLASAFFTEMERRYL